MIIALILLGLMAAVLAYPRLPEQVASHWNAQGQVDDYTPRFWGVALMPLICIATTLLLWWLPSIDPLKANIQTFRPTYNLFVVVMVLYFLYVYAATLAVNLGVPLNMSVALVPAFAGLSYLMGVLVSNARRNFFIGIRTPWTLSSDSVWDQTHRRGGRLFKWSVPVILLGLLFPSRAFAFLIAPLLGISLYLYIYSYWLYRGESESAR